MRLISKQLKLIPKSQKDSSAFYLSEIGFIPRYAEYIDGFDHEYFGFNADFNLPQSYRWLQKYRSQNYKYAKTAIEESVEVCFFNMDSAFWEFFSNDNIMINILIEYMEELRKNLFIESSERLYTKISLNDSYLFL